MITQISLKNFKSIKEADLKLGPFNLFIGTNASGKSNFFDALRFLQGIGWGLSIDEILNGRPRTGTGSEWDGVRGGSGFLRWKGAQWQKDKGDRVRIEAAIALKNKTGDTENLRYGIEIHTGRNLVSDEFLLNEANVGWDTRPVENDPISPGIKVQYRGREIGLDKHRPLIQEMQDSFQFEADDEERAARVMRSLGNSQRVDPQPGILRQYAPLVNVERMGEHGENFAALVAQIDSDAKLQEGYLGWLQELRPAEVGGIKIFRGALNEPLFGLTENGQEFPAPVLSDGTLRFAAICAAFFQPSMPEVLMLEEIENGIHAGRLRLLLELIKSRAGATQTQVMATSHSALMLDWLAPEDYQYVFLCSRDAETGVTKITPLTEVPHFLEAVKTTPASQLISEGWMEAAL